MSRQVKDAKDMLTLKKSRFTENMVRLNSLSLRRWVFEAGMEFLSDLKWWGDKGHRGRQHNGLDMLYYETAGSELKTIGENTRIPIIYPGMIIKRVNDFLGYTLFAAHEIFDGDCRLFTLYGHVIAVPDIDEGEYMDEGMIIATLPPSKSGKVPSHLHISAVFIPKDMPVENLSWKMLDELTSASFVDPQEII